MSDGGTWQPPQPSAAPPPPPGDGFGPPAASPPTTPTPTMVTAEPAAPGRSTGKIIAAAVGALAIAGGGVFAISQMTGESASGGAATPEEAGLALLAAIENEDVLGMIDVLLPGERETLREPVTELAAELQRLGVLSDDSLSGIAGVDFTVEGESVEAEATNVDDIVNLQITASIGGSIEGDSLPIGPWIRDNLDTDLSDLDTEGPAEEGTLPVTAVEQDGRWYLSLFYTAAESARSELGEDIPAEGVTPSGGDSPEAAIDVILDGATEFDLEAVIAGLNPNEFEALQRYAPLFLDEAQAELDEVEGVELEITDRTYDVSGSGDRRSVTITELAIEASAEGESATIELRDGCWIVTAEGETVNSCEIAEDLPTLEEITEDSEELQDLLESFQATFDDYENPGLIVEQVDGQWFLSPMATGSEQVLAVIRSLSREEIEDLADQVSEMSDTFEDEILDDDGALPLPDLDDFELPGDEDVVIDDVPASTVPAEGSDEGEATGGSVEDDPEAVCYGESEAAAAAACFQELVDAGAIEAALVPWYLRFPECGAAEIAWSGDYYSLPDEEFIALVADVAPCFQQLVTDGKAEEFDLPFEMTKPECLAGRNWYTVDEQEYLDAFDDCIFAD